MYLDIYFDTICPWCLIGKKRLENALKSRAQVSLKLRWRPFLLNPTMVGGGMDRDLYLEQKFGGPERAKRVYDVIDETGRNAGVGFQFQKIKRTPNSIDSHRLCMFAEEVNLESQMVQRLFEAYFYEGLDIGDLSVLIRLAKDIGLDETQAKSFLKSDKYRIEVIESDQKARELGVHGVPAFVARERYVVSGAQEPKVLGKFIDTALNG